MGATQSSSRADIADYLCSLGYPDYSHALAVKDEQSEDGLAPIDSEYLRTNIVDHISMTELVFSLAIDETHKDGIYMLAAEWILCTGSCMHQYLQRWGTAFHCIDCHAQVDTEQTDRVRFSTGPKYSGEELQRKCGLSIGWLVEWTNHRRCWSWTTRNVWRQFILSETRHLRCRYVDLDNVRPHAGPAATFISHTWSGTWGDLVAAVAYGADPNRKVWLDIFAVCQWPLMEGAEFDFAETIANCSSFMLVCSIPTNDDTVRLDALTNFRSYPHTVRRIWCLAEIFAASSLRSKIAVIIQIVGRRRAGTLAFSRDQVYLNVLCSNVNVGEADATILVDKNRILSRIQDSNGGNGFQVLNEMIAGILLGSRITEQFRDYNDGDHVPLYIRVQCAACGDEVSILTQTPEAVILCAAQGYHRLLAKLARESIYSCGDDINPKIFMDSNGVGALHHAAGGGHLQCIQVLIKDFHMFVDSTDSDGNTPLMYACKHGSSQATSLLIEHGADVAIRSNYGLSAWDIAREKNHADCIEALETCSLVGTLSQHSAQEAHPMR
jgi:DNA-directed RNA polymerase subunit RPC12/RpoP